MTVQRIDSDARRMHGWQARERVIGARYVSRFFSDGVCGGSEAAYRLAEAEQPALRRKAARLRRALEALTEGQPA